MNKGRYYVSSRRTKSIYGTRIFFYNNLCNLMSRYSVLACSRVWVCYARQHAACSSSATMSCVVISRRGRAVGRYAPHPIRMRVWVSSLLGADNEPRAREPFALGGPCLSNLPSEICSSGHYETFHNALISDEGVTCARCRGYGLRALDGQRSIESSTKHVPATYLPMAAITLEWTIRPSRARAAAWFRSRAAARAKRGLPRSHAACDHCVSAPGGNNRRAARDRSGARNWR